MRIEPIKPTRKNKPWFLQKFQFGGLPGFNIPASLANAFENTDFGDWSSIQSAATSVGGQNVADAFAQDNPDLITGNVMQSLAYSQGLSKAYEQNPIRTAEQIDADAEAAAKRRTFLGIGKKKAKRKAAEELQGMNDRRIANNENLAGAYAPIENSNMVTQYAGMANLMALLDGFQFQQGGPTNFEQRIQHPTLSLVNKDGTKSSHKMMSFGIDGKHYAAPTIVEVNGALVELSPEEAINYAMSTGEYKEFKTERQARRYAENGYKKGTPMDMRRFQQGGTLEQKNQQLLEAERDYQMGYITSDEYARRLGNFPNEYPDPRATQAQHAKNMAETSMAVVGDISPVVVGDQVIYPEGDSRVTGNDAPVIRVKSFSARDRMEVTARHELTHASRRNRLSDEEQAFIQARILSGNRWANKPGEYHAQIGSARKDAYALGLTSGKYGDITPEAILGLMNSGEYDKRMQTLIDLYNSTAGKTPEEKAKNMADVWNTVAYNSHKGKEAPVAQYGGLVAVLQQGGLLPEAVVRGESPTIYVSDPNDPRIGQRQKALEVARLYDAYHREYYDAFYNDRPNDIHTPGGSRDKLWAAMQSTGIEFVPVSGGYENNPTDTWVSKSGQRMTVGRHYVPIPSEVVYRDPNERVRDWKGVPNLKIVSIYNPKTKTSEPQFIENSAGERIGYKEYKDKKMPEGFQYPQRFQQGGAAYDPKYDSYSTGSYAKGTHKTYKYRDGKWYVYEPFSAGTPVGDGQLPPEVEQAHRSRTGPLVTYSVTDEYGNAPAQANEDLTTAQRAGLATILIPGAMTTGVVPVGISMGLASGAAELIKPGTTREAAANMTGGPLPQKKQTGGVAQLGYSVNSPYKNMPAIDIPGNNITMANTNRPLMAYPNVGHPRLLLPFSGTHIFPGATSVREVPVKKKGGKPKKYYQAGGPGSGAVGAQLEDGEFFVTGNVDIMETAARAKHKNMKSDMVTDILGKEDYVFSAMDNRVITRKQAEAASFGYGGMLYEEGEKPDLPVETTAASIFKDGEQELSITDYVKRVRDKYKVRSMDEADIFTKKTNAANKEARIPFLMFASGMNESKRKGKNKSGWVSSYENMFEDSIMNSANLEKEDGEYGIHPNQGGDAPEFQGGGLAALSVLSPLLGIGLGIGQLGANKNNYLDTTKFLAQDRNDINSLAQTQSQFSGLSTAAQMAGILGQDPYVEAPQFDTTQLDATIRRTPRSVFDLQVARLSSASKPYMNQLFNNAGSFSEAVNAYSPVAASNASSMADIGMNQALQDINMENNYRLQKQGYADRQVLADVGARNATKDNANRLTNAFAGVTSSGIEGQGQIESQRQNALRANNQAKLQSVMAWRQGKANAWKGILGNVGAGSQALYNTQLLKMYPPTNGVQTTTGVPDLGPYPEEQSMMPPPPLPWESPDMNSYLYAPMPYYPIDPNGVPTNNLPWATRPRG